MSTIPETTPKRKAPTAEVKRKRRRRRSGIGGFHAEDIAFEVPPAVLDPRAVRFLGASICRRLERMRRRTGLRERGELFDAIGDELESLLPRLARELAEHRAGLDRPPDGWWRDRGEQGDDDDVPRAPEAVN